MGILPTGTKANNDHLIRVEQLVESADDTGKVQISRWKKISKQEAVDFLKKRTDDDASKSKKKKTVKLKRGM